MLIVFNNEVKHYIESILPPMKSYSILQVCTLLNVFL